MTDTLIQGFKQFRAHAYSSLDAPMPRLARDGQDPDYFIISCIDSRGNPGTIFNAPPGTFFAHKAMGAIVRPYKQGTALAAALQFALNYNKVTKLIVLGHTGCGAVKALIEGIQDEEIWSFIEVARAGLNKVKSYIDEDQNLARHVEEQIVLLSAENLKSYPSVRKALDDKRVVIKPWLFDLHAGDLLEYNPDRERFDSLIGAQHA